MALVHIGQDELDPTRQHIMFTSLKLKHQEKSVGELRTLVPWSLGQALHDPTRQRSQL
jgi:hypothetical protein